MRRLLVFVCGASAEPAISDASVEAVVLLSYEFEKPLYGFSQYIKQGLL